MKKRIIALALALCMFGSSLFAGPSNELAYAYEAEQLFNDLRKVGAQGKVDASSENKLANEDALNVKDKFASFEGEKPSKDTETKQNETTKIDVTVDKADLNVDLKVDALENTLLNESTVSDTDMVDVIIVFDSNAVIDDDPDAEMNIFTKLKVAFMEIVQNVTIWKIETGALDGKALDIDYQYTWLLNGIATKVPYGLIDEIEEISGVKEVILQPVYEVSDAKVVNPFTVSDGGMIGREDSWASGYTGKGIKIAIIDTGIDEDHQNFQAMNSDKLTSDSATKDSINAVIGSLNASAVFSDLTADDVYLSNKIAYAFNYADGNLSINHKSDRQGDHGTHVAGIAAANDIKNGEAVGVAPDAQLYIMKVFGTNPNGASAASLLAAVEDAMILGADVINMSVGSAAGFTSDGEEFDAIYGKIAEAGVVLAVSAGNSETSAYGNAWGTDQNLTSNPDNATISAPGTYINATTVASVENVALKFTYVEVAGKKYAYYPSIVSSGTVPNAPVSTIAGNEYEIAFVPNAGKTAEDFESVDCEGKVVLVQRGVTAFTEKCQLAQDAGAIACIVFNSEPGMFGMQMDNGTATIPCVSISLQSGEQILASLNENPAAKIVLSDEEALVPNDDAYKMSTFSSWGVSPDLKLEPDITAPGGNIYSTLDDGDYGIMSGTSMSSPNVAGMAALMKQYVKANYPKLTNTGVHKFINALLMSTATVLEDNEIAYSPRLQGAGLANAYLAINTNAYLTVDGMDMPKVELLDDPEKTGNYNYSFNVVNFGSTAIYYRLNTTTQTEGVDLYAMSETEYLGFMNSTPVELDATTSESSNNMVLTYDYNEDKKANVVDAYELYANVLGKEADNEFFRYNLDEDEDLDKADVQAYLDALVGKTEDVALDDTVLEVKAGETAKVDVSVVVGDEGKEYMDTYFENGIYVEGFTTLTAESTGDVDLSLPYMGFYGDWTQAPIIDSGFYWETEEATFGSQYDHYLFTNFGGEASAWFPGLNPYFGTEEPVSMDNIVLSPNWDGYADYIDDMYISLLRNADELSFTYKDEDGNVLFENVIEHVKKSVYMDAYQQIVPFVYSWYSDPYYMMDEEGYMLPNNMKLTLTINAKLDYEEHESNNKFDTLEIPITVDVTAPEILDAYIEEVKDETTNETRYYLHMKFADNHATAGVFFLSKSGTMELSRHFVDHSKEEGTEYVTYDVTGYGEAFYVVLGDYAFNEEAYYIEAVGNEPKVDKSLLYGYRVFDLQMIGDDRRFGWLAINKEDADTQVVDSEYYLDYALVAAEYVGGYIIAVDANKDLVYIKPGYWDERTVISHLGSEVRDMTFDPKTKNLYAIHSDKAMLVTIDVGTGEVTEIGEPGALSSVLTLTCDDNGQLYTIDMSGQLLKIDKTKGEIVEGSLLDTAELTGMLPSYAQSMTYDSEAECIYWACFYDDALKGVYGVLVKIDVNATTPSMEIIGQIAGGAEVVGLLTLDNKGYEIPLGIEPGAIESAEEEIALLVGDSKTLNLIVSPWYADLGSVTWTSANENVATVNPAGMVTATGVGTTTITATVVVSEDVVLTANTTVSVLAPNANLNGFVVYGWGGNLENQWINFDADKMVYDAKTKFTYNSYTAGEYVDGIIYTYAQDSAFYKIDTTNDYEVLKVGSPRSDYTITDMSYDYSSGMMYALAQDMDYGDVYLAQIDMNTGEIMLVAPMEDAYGDIICALAVSTEGVIYVMSGTGILYTANPETAELTSLGYVGCSTESSYAQSMTYDHNADRPGLYWATTSGDFPVMYIDLKTVTALNLGVIDEGAQMTSLYIVPEYVPALEDVDVESVELTADSVTVLTGGKVVAPVQVLPLNATNRDVVWTVEDESVAIIRDGMIVGVGKGTTTAVGTIAGLETEELEITVLNAAEELRGYLLADLYTGDSGFWMSVDDRDLSQDSSKAITDYTPYFLNAGEYYDGHIYGYGVDVDTNEPVFVVLNEVENPRENDELYVTEKIEYDDYPDVLDMAFDYTEGVMYAVAGARNVEGASALYCVDITTGQLYKVCDMDDQVMTLACTADGYLYGVSVDGVFYEIDKYTGELEYIAQTDYIANQYQSMAYDYNSGNIYWSQIVARGWSASANLLIINPEDGSTIDLGHIGMYGAQVTALHTVPKEEIEVGTAELDRVALNSSSEVLKPGESVTLYAVALPVSVNAIEAEFVFESDNTKVATVDENGVVTALTAGKANIKVTANGKSATCKINVVGDETKIQAMSNNGWQVTPLLNPTISNDTVALPAGLDLALVTYVDGWYYGLDTANAYEGEEAEYQMIAYSRGNLWRFNEDLTVVEKVSDTPVYTTFDDCDGEYYVADAVIDIFSNPFTGQVYVLGRVIEDDYWYVYAIYELDVETGAAELAGYVSYDISTPQKVEFIDETTMAVWDCFDDYVYTMSIYDTTTVSQLVWAQRVLASSYNLGFAYNKELDVIFVASLNARDSESKKIALYMIDPNKKTIKEVSDTVFSTDMIDILFVQ